MNNIIQSCGKPEPGSVFAMAFSFYPSSKTACAKAHIIDNTIAQS